MASLEAAAAVEADGGAASSPLIRRSATVVAVAGGIGVAGQLLFYDVGLGVNFPIAIALLLIGGWLLRSRPGRPSGIDLWLAPAAVGFAAFAAIRADPSIVALDVLTALALSGAALASFAGQPVVGRSFAGLVELLAKAAGWAVTGAARAISQARAHLPRGPQAMHRARRAAPVLRGLALALPIVLVFVALFAAADAVFARIVEDLFRFDLELGDLIGRILLAVLLAWLAAGGLALAAAERRPDASGQPLPALRWRFGTTEAITVLLAINAVFMAFVALQAAYLFGGLDTLEAAGMTYADYARRGFFELVAVAILAGGLVVALERTARERHRLLIGAAVALAVLTGIVLVSATLRLRLYQEAYGWTELRLYVLATIALLAILLVGLIVTLLRDRVAWIGHVAIAAALAIGLALNLLGPVRFVAEQNVERLLNPALVPAHGSAGFDELYVLSLGDDAIPSLLRALPHLDPTQAAFLRDDLRFRRAELRVSPGLNAWQAWNAGREAARDALEAARGRGELD